MNVQEPTDEASFAEALEVLVRTANENGVEVERDWPCRGDEGPDWAVDVVRLAPPERSTDR